jgi:hypothetical protein
VKYTCQIPRTIVRKVPLCPVTDCCSTPTVVAPAPVVVSPAPVVIPQPSSPTPANGAGSGATPADQQPHIDPSQKVPMPQDERGAEAAAV